MFLFHYGQVEGRRQSITAVTLNVLKRKTITYYSINFDQHKSFYDFF